MEKFRGLMNRIGEFAEKIEKLQYSDDFTKSAIYNLICGMVALSIVTVALGGILLCGYTLFVGPMILAPVVGIVAIALLTFLLTFSKAIGFD